MKRREGRARGGRGGEAQDRPWQARDTLLMKVLHALRRNPRGVRGAPLFRFLAEMLWKSSRGLGPAQGPPVTEEGLLEWLPEILLLLACYTKDLAEREADTCADASWALSQVPLVPDEVLGSTKEEMERVARRLLVASREREMGVQSALEGATSAAEPEERIRCLRALAALAETGPAFPFARAVAALKRRSLGFGSDGERDHLVLDVARDCLDRVAVARARREGLRVPRPPAVETLPPDQLHRLPARRAGLLPAPPAGRAPRRVPHLRAAA